MNPNTRIRIKSVKLIARFLRIMADEDLLSVPEMNAILAELKHLAVHGENMPPIMPKLIKLAEAAEMLSIGISNFKTLEKSGVFPFKRRKIGGAVRYINTDIIKFIMSEDTTKDSDGDFVT